MADIRIALDLVSAQPIGVTGAGGHTTRSMTGRATLSWSSRTEAQVLRVGYCDTTPMHVHIQGAREHNLRDVDVRFGDGHTVVTGVSGSGTTSLIFDTLYHEARQRFWKSSRSVRADCASSSTALRPTVPAPTMTA